MLDVGAAVSAAAAAAAVAGVVLLLRRHGATDRVALCAGATLAASGGLWAFATRMEVYALGALAVVVWLAVVSGPAPARGGVAVGTAGTAVAGQPVLAGAAAAGAILCHAALGLLLVPTVWRYRSRPRDAGAVLLGALAVPALVLTLVMGAAQGVWNPLRWAALAVPSTGSAEGWLAMPSPVAFAGALRSLVLWRWYAQVPVFGATGRAALAAAGWALLACGAVLLAAGLRNALRRAGDSPLESGDSPLVPGALRGDDPLFRMAAGGIAALLPLWLVWDAGNVEHLVAAAPLFAVLLAAAVPAEREGSPRFAATALCAFAAGLAVTNGAGSAVPQSRPENGRMWVTAGFVTEKVPADALLLTCGADARARLSLSYLSGRRVADLAIAVHAARRAGRSPEEGLASWLLRARGSPNLWVADDLQDPACLSFVESSGISRASWSAALAPLSVGPADILEPDGAVITKPFALRPAKFGDRHP